MAVASTALITALKASLADADAQWSVIGGTRNEIKEPTQASGEGGLEPMEMTVVRVDYTVALSSPVVRVAVGAYGPLNIAYIGSTEGDGETYLRSSLYIDGHLFTAVDEALHDQVMALADIATDAIDAEVTASLEHGPQSNEDLEALQ